MNRRQFVAFFAGGLSAGWDHVRSGGRWIAFGRKPALCIPDDPLGCDLTDVDAGMRAMTGDALSGRTRDAVRTELVAVRRIFAISQKIEFGRRNLSFGRGLCRKTDTAAEKLMLAISTAEKRIQGEAAEKLIRLPKN